MSNQKELLGKRIKELRKQKGYTQDYLAEKLKIEPRQLSKLETGKHYPSFETIIALLETIDITCEELISFEHLNSANDIRKTLLKDIENIDDSKIQNVYKILRVLIN